MSDTNTPLPAAGWYPDPAGTSRTRWWNGSGWSDSYGQPAEAARAAQPAPYSAAPAYTNAPAYGTTEVLRAPEGTSPITPFIWPLALLPIISIIANIVSLTMIDQIISDTLDDNAPIYTPFDLAVGVVGWVVIGLTILFAILDYRALKSAGVPKPFHWAWIFFALISAPVVYMIGRSVVVRRRTGTGLTPMFVNLALILVNVIITIASFFLAIAATIPMIDTY